MTDTTVDTLAKAIGAGSLAFGVLATVSPTVLRRSYGDRRSTGGALNYFGRTWGTRTAAFGALTLAAGSDGERERIAMAAAAMNSLDALAAWGATGMPVATRVMAGFTSAAFAAGSAYVAANL